MTPEEQADYKARRGTAEDIINLVSIYSQLEESDNGDLLRQAVELLAAQRVIGLKTPDGEHYDAHDWLEHLADDTYPHDLDVARLLGGGFDVHADGREFVFPDGQLGVLLTSSAQEEQSGMGLYLGYQMIENDEYPIGNLPSAASFFGFDEDQRNYVEYEYYETEEEWKDGIHRQCAAEFTGLVSLWRSKFFKALLSKTWPTAR